MIKQKDVKNYWNLSLVEQNRLLQNVKKQEKVAVELGKEKWLLCPTCNMLLAKPDEETDYLEAVRVCKFCDAS